MTNRELWYMLMEIRAVIEDQLGTLIEPPVDQPPAPPTPAYQAYPAEQIQEAFQAKAYLDWIQANNADVRESADRWWVRWWDETSWKDTQGDMQSTAKEAIALAIVTSKGPKK